MVIARLESPKELISAKVLFDDCTIQLLYFNYRLAVFQLADPK